jgi:hypothetical protein
MKYENLILITLNNTLHIKADNLEAVEVDSSCVEQLELLVYPTQAYKSALPTGINISELSDRIEVRDKRLYRDDNGTFIGCKLFAFLLPVKEDKCPKCRTTDFKSCHSIFCPMRENTNNTDENTHAKISEKSYSIEEIEKAIDKSGGLTVDKQEILNNLKK